MLFLTDIRENLFGYSAGYHFTRLTVATIIYIGLALVFSIIFLMMGINSKKIKTRKTFSLLLYGFFLSVILYFALPTVSAEIVWITALPASYFLAHYFVFAKKKLVPEIIFSGLFLLILLIQILYIF
jgi:hypothetical protein